MSWDSQRHKMKLVRDVSDSDSDDSDPDYSPVYPPSEQCRTPLRPKKLPFRTCKQPSQSDPRMNMTPVVIISPLNEKVLKRKILLMSPVATKQSLLELEHDIYSKSPVNDCSQKEALASHMDCSEPPPLYSPMKTSDNVPESLPSFSSILKVDACTEDEASAAVDLPGCGQSLNINRSSPQASTEQCADAHIWSSSESSVQSCALSPISKQGTVVDNQSRNSHEPIMLQSSTPMVDRENYSVVNSQGSLQTVSKLQVSREKNETLVVSEAKSDVFPDAQSCLNSFSSKSKDAYNNSTLPYQISAEASVRTSSKILDDCSSINKSPLSNSRAEQKNVSIADRHWKDISFYDSPVRSEFSADISEELPSFADICAPTRDVDSPIEEVQYSVSKDGVIEIDDGSVCDLPDIEFVDMAPVTVKLEPCSLNDEILDSQPFTNDIQPRRREKTLFDRDELEEVEPSINLKRSIQPPHPALAHNCESLWLNMKHDARSVSLQPTRDTSQLDYELKHLQVSGAKSSRRAVGFLCRRISSDTSSPLVLGNQSETLVNSVSQRLVASPRGQTKQQRFRDACDAQRLIKATISLYTSNVSSRDSTFVKDFFSWDGLKNCINSMCLEQIENPVSVDTLESCSNLLECYVSLLSENFRVRTEGNKKFKDCLASHWLDPTCNCTARAELMVMSIKDCLKYMSHVKLITIRNDSEKYLEQRRTTNTLCSVLISLQRCLGLAVSSSRSPTEASRLISPMLMNSYTDCLPLHYRLHLLDTIQHPLLLYTVLSNLFTRFATLQQPRESSLQAFVETYFSLDIHAIDWQQGGSIFVDIDMDEDVATDRWNELLSWLKLFLPAYLLCSQYKLKLDLKERLHMHSKGALLSLNEETKDWGQLFLQKVKLLEHQAVKDIAGVYASLPEPIYDRRDPLSSDSSDSESVSSSEDFSNCHRFSGSRTPIKSSLSNHVAQVSTVTSTTSQPTRYSPATNTSLLNELPLRIRTLFNSLYCLAETLDS